MIKPLFTIIACLLLTSGLDAQPSFERIVKQYYRVSPFDGPFSAFMKALTTDPELLNKEVFKKTEFSDYLVKGEYKKFNPFNITAESVEMLFYEDKFKVDQRPLFKHYTYQLRAFFSDTENERKAVRKEYRKLSKKLRLQMQNIEKVKLKDGEETSFRNELALAPAVVCWEKLSDKPYIRLSITIKLKQYGDYAYPINTATLIDRKMSVGELGRYL